MEAVNALMHQNYENSVDAITFGISSLTAHNTDIIGRKPSLSSSSSTSSTSSAASSSSSSQSSLNAHKSHPKQHVGTLLKSGTKQLSNSTNELICPLCKTIFKEPKLLNCLHSFCKQCLIDNFLSGCGERNTSINCPRCKQETMICEGIDNLQDDCIIHNMLDMDAIEANTLICTSCSSEEKAEARCADCVQYLCDTCVKHHKELRCFDGHRVVCFKDLKSMYYTSLKIPVHRPIFCKIHDKESLKFFCNTCQIPICAECVVNNHTLPNHQYVRIAVAETQNVEELEFLIEKCKERIIECNGDMLQTLDGCLTDLQKKFEHSREAIEETHRAYAALVEKRKDELMKELEERHTNKEMMILDMNNSINKSIDQLNDLIKFIQRCLTKGNCPEILQLKSMILNQLRYLTENLPEVYKIDIDINFQADCNRFEKNLNENCGRFVCDKEMKEKLLNQLQSESMNKINGLQYHSQYSQKQLEIQKKLQRQEWVMENQLKSQQLPSHFTYLTTMDENQVSMMPSSPISESQSDDWMRNAAKPGYEENQINQIGQTIHANKFLTSLSPQSTNSDNSLWLNKNPSSLAQQKILQAKLNQANISSYQLTLAQQQMLIANLQSNVGFQNAQRHQQQTGRSNSPIRFQQHQSLNQMQQNSVSRSETPSFSSNSNAEGSVLSNVMNQQNNWQSTLQFENNINIDDFNPFGTNGNCGTLVGGGKNCVSGLNFNMMNKMSAPPSNPTEFGLNKMCDFAVPSARTFSETLSNSSPSPPGQQLVQSVGPIGSGFHSVIAESLQQQQSGFHGNGNLNPPVRQNGKMSSMIIRNKFGTLGSGRIQFNSPHGFCLGVEEEIIVADTNNHRIHLFTKDGELKYSFGSPGKDEGQLWYPRKVTIMRESGRFVVCDRGNERSRMQIFSKTGHFVKKISIRYIDIVAGLAVSSNNDIIAVDSVSPTVFRINYETGDLVKWFDCSACMREPSDIAISGNEYFVCDFKGHCVVVFNEEGNFMRKIGGENITNFPNGIDVSDAGDVLVGDSHGNRFHIAVFTREGELVSEFECPSVKVSRCCGLKITSEGYVVTLAKNNHHVLVLNTLYVS